MDYNIFDIMYVDDNKIYMEYKILNEMKQKVMKDGIKCTSIEQIRIGFDVM